MKTYKREITFLSLWCMSLVAGLDQVQAAPDAAELDWLKQSAVPIKTCEAGNGFEDLAPLKRMIGDARIVSLGECTHGTREVFQMKHRLLEYLVTQCGFSVFSIEANMPEAYRLNDYVLEGKGDPAQLISGMYFWTWRTEEVLAMVEWMRQFNQSGKGRVEFTGFDMQTPDVAMGNVLEFIRKNDPARHKEIQQAYQQVKNRKRGGAAGSSFAVATGSFPVDQAAGKKIRYSGWIKTAGVTRDYAGLWWRADGEKGVLAFDNMQAREIRGDTDWTEYEVVLNIPKDVVNINFGVLLAGDGKTWFDDLKVEIDGQRYEPASRFDFGFEGDTPKGFFTGGADYVVAIDEKVAKAGKHSLRMEFTGTGKGEEGMKSTDAAKSCGGILRQMESKRGEYAQRTSARAADWAIQNARVVHQALLLEAQEVQRDVSMAANVKWILDQAPKGTRIVLWAHNGHVARQKFFAVKAMGACLDEMYGKDQVVIGFSAGEGQYTAIAPNKGLRHDNPLQPPPMDSFENYFRACGIPTFILDLRLATKEDAGSGWLTRQHRARSIGALAMDEQFFPAKLPDLYDAMIYIDKTSASRPLPERGLNSGKK